MNPIGHIIYQVFGLAASLPYSHRKPEPKTKTPTIGAGGESQEPGSHDKRQGYPARTAGTYGPDHDKGHTLDVTG